MTDTNWTGPRTYGNWRKPISRGLGGVGFIPTIFGFIFALIVLVVAITRGLLPALIVALTFAIVLAAVAVRDKHGQSGLIRLTTRIGWIMTRSRGLNLYRSGPTGMALWGTAQLPGLAAGTKLTEWRDSYNRPFALLEHPAKDYFTVVFASEPDGSSLVDPDQVDIWVASWGGWLRRLGDEPGVEAAAVTIETAPDTGTRMSAEVLGRISANASPLSQNVLRRIVATYPAGSASIRSYVSVTFNARATTTGKRREAEEVARDLSSRLPSLTQGLSATGAGTARPVSAQELCEVVRVAYDPAAAWVIDQARAQGMDEEIYWPEVGPVAHQANWDSYRHDSALSMTWMMSTAPQGNVQSGVLAPLLAPMRDIARKRVTMLYRPIDQGRATAIVESDSRAADFLATATRRGSARTNFAARAAASNEAEVASGAGLVNFGMIVTASVTDPRLLDEARSAIDHVSLAAKVRLRPAYGSQDAAFAAALPLGLVLPKHLAIPHNFREQL